jgi:hypothetical protein
MIENGGAPMPPLLRRAEQRSELGPPLRYLPPMPHNGALVFSDIAGNLDLLRIECAKCGRAGRYRVGRLITARGADMDE